MLVSFPPNYEGQTAMQNNTLLHILMQIPSAVQRCTNETCEGKTQRLYYTEK